MSLRTAKAIRMAQTRNPILKPLRILRNRWRLFASIAAGLILPYLLPGSWTFPTQILVGWDSGVILYLGIALVEFARFDIKRVRARCSEQDEGAILVLILTVVAAIASLVAIVALLGAEKNAGSGAQKIHLALAVGTILLSWAFIHVIFALHYTHEFYGEGADDRHDDLHFPGDNRPDYWDFIYFSFVVGMTFQVSDVQVTSKKLRHLVVAHGIVSFLFSIAILALAVNICSSLI
jgi:uncharacterized membrane protein